MLAVPPAREAADAEARRAEVAPARLRDDLRLGSSTLPGRVVEVFPSTGQGAERRRTFLFVPWSDAGLPLDPPRLLACPPWFLREVELDTLGDLRAAFGAIDAASGVEIGSDEWRRGVLRLLDPTGDLGLGDGGSPPRCEPGWLLRALVEDATPPQPTSAVDFGWSLDRLVQDHLQVIGTLARVQVWAAVPGRYEDALRPAVAGALALLVRLAAVDPGAARDGRGAAAAQRAGELGGFVVGRLAAVADPRRSDEAGHPVFADDREERGRSLLDLMEAEPVFLEGGRPRPGWGAVEDPLLEVLVALAIGLEGPDREAWTPSPELAARARTQLVRMLRPPEAWLDEEAPGVAASAARRATLSRFLDLEPDGSPPSPEDALRFELTAEFGWGTPDEVGDVVDRFVDATRGVDEETPLGAVPRRMLSVLRTMARGLEDAHSARQGVARVVERRVRDMRRRARDTPEGPGSAEAKRWLQRFEAASPLGDP